MSYYRERFGHRPGEFPVCEDVAERSWRCRSSRR
jgi:perosamine synthetase